MDLVKSITNFLNEVKDAYSKDLVRFKSSGQSQNELRVDVSDKSSGWFSVKGSLKGPHYLYFLRHGRRPGKFPPVSAMLDFIRAKGLKGRDKKGKFITDRSLAFLIGRALAEKGNRVYQGKVAPLNVDDEIVKLKDKLTKEIASAGARLLTSSR